MHDLSHRARPRCMRPLVLCVGASLLLAGCASIGPKPWQKDLMARPEMQVGANSIVEAVNDHIYFSKEAASGGRGFAGGGCGCN